jgi:protein-tyrosine phosphatase
MQSPTQTLRIVCVCSGNICRSPMAQGLVRRKLSERGRAAAVISAGTLDLGGRSAAEHACTAMRMWGEPIEGHRSQKVSIPLLQLADYVLVMSPNHEAYILAADPRLERRLVRIWEYASTPLEEPGIPDPVGRELEDFIGCRDLLEDCIGRWIESLT